MEIQKQMKERGTLKKARQWANRKSNESTVEGKARREKVAQKRGRKKIWKQRFRQSSEENKWQSIQQKNEVWKHYRQNPEENK
jgi:hypothetical protein